MIAATAVRGTVRLPVTVAEAQALVEAHLNSAPFTGRCNGCKEMAPCRSRELAHAAFRRLDALPVRKPKTPWLTYG
jgi:hypothetical protein